MALRNWVEQRVVGKPHIRIRHNTDYKPYAVSFYGQAAYGYRLAETWNWLATKLNRPDMRPV